MSPDFVACPSCGHHVGGGCPHCNRPIQAGWKFCPYCAQSTDAQPKRGGHSQRRALRQQKEMRELPAANVAEFKK